MKDALILDVAYAWRRLTRGRVFAAVAGVSMAAATVAVGTMFAIVNTTDIRALAYDPQDRIVVIQSRHDTASATPRTTGPSSTMLIYADLRRRLSKVADLEAVGLVIKRDADPDRAGDIIDGHVATPGFKAVAGATVDRGRWFVDADTVSGAPGTVVLSHAYWLSRFGGDTGIVGREVLLADRFPATPDSFLSPYSVSPVTICDSAQVFDPTRDVHVFPDSAGWSKVKMSFLNNACLHRWNVLCPVKAIDATIWYRANPAADGGYELRWERDGFPSMGVYSRNTTNTGWDVVKEDAQKTSTAAGAIRDLAGWVQSKGWNYPPPPDPPAGCYRQ
jgi:hypothetical protein